MKHSTKQIVTRLAIILALLIVLVAIFIIMILYPISVQNVSLRTVSNLTLTFKEYEQSFNASGEIFAEVPFAQSDDLSDYCKISVEPELLNHGFFPVDSISFMVKNDTNNPAIIAVEYFEGDPLSPFEIKHYDANTVLFVYRGDYTEQELLRSIADLTLVLQYKGVLRTVYREIPLVEYLT